MCEEPQKTTEEDSRGENERHMSGTQTAWKRCERLCVSWGIWKRKNTKRGKRVGQQYETPRTSLEKSRATAVVHFLKKNFILQFCFPAKWEKHRIQIEADLEGKKWLNLEEKIGSQLLWVLQKGQILLLPTRALLVCSMSLCVLKIGSSQVNCSL